MTCIKNLLIEGGFEEIENEIFKECLPDFPEYYVSNMGRVFSLKRKKFLKPAIDGKKAADGSRIGYDFVTLSVKGKRTQRYVHRLVAEQFIEGVEGRPYVDHIDACKRNNQADNLRWVTPSENIILGKGVMVRVKRIDKGNSMSVYYNSISEAAKAVNVDYFKLRGAILYKKPINGYFVERVGRMKGNKAVSLK